jgi:heme/copper-type cytochrome/quinol oxidase subunit 2
MKANHSYTALARAFMAAAIVLTGASSALACPMCFGAQETTLVDGTKLGMLVLLFIVLAMQAAFAGFFLYLRRRAKRMADLDIDIEWSQLQEGTSK